MSQTPDTSSLLKRTAGYVRRAQASLYWERYAPVFALAAAIAIIFLIGAFGGVWERIGDPWRLIVLAVAIFFLIKAALAAHKKTRPNLSEARRRVETDSNIAHRPLDVLEDSPALSKEAWPAHYQKAQKDAEALRPARWRHALKPIDPYYLRFVLPCALGLAMMVGFGDNYERLRRSLSPTWQSAINPADVTYEAWIDPPEYTGRPPLYFKDKTKIDVPTGSELVARISGIKDAPRLKLGRKYLKLKRLGPKSFEARTILKDKSTARWRIGTQEKKWVLNVLPDTEPYVVFEDLPKADKRDRLAFTYSFEDDYGIETFELKMRLMTEDSVEAAKSSTVTVPLSSSSVKRAEDADAALDLTKHEWAGRKVAGVLVVTDGMGQIDESQESFFIVPDKIFVEPMAKAIIEQRNLVIAGSGDYAPEPENYDYRNAPYFDTYEPEFRMNRAPAQIQRAAILIDALTDRPAGIFSDPAIFMGLKNVHGRLRYGRKASDLRGIPEDLWRIAIRAEFGVLGTALEEMREAKEALQDGMARRAPEREIDTLFDRYDQAVERYMEELRRKAIEDGNIADAEGGGGGGGRNADEIEELLKAIEEANKAGDTEGARKALARLAELLENMEMQLTRGGSGEGEDSMAGEMSEEMKESLEDLADLLGDQRELQDETRQAENEAQQDDEGAESGDGEQSGQQEGGQQAGGQEGESSSGQGGSQQGEGALSPGELAARQGALQEALDALEGALPEEGDGTGISDGEEQDGSGFGEEEGEEGRGGWGETDPDSENRGGGGTGEEQQNAAEALAKAGEAMRESQERLNNGDMAGANDAQAEAIRALREAGQAMAESGRQQGRGQGGSEEADNDDPLGRDNAGGNADESQADLDTRDDATRSRELREELRRRAAEQERDESERKYLERLLKRF